MPINITQVMKALEELAGPAAGASAVVREALLLEAKRGENYARSIAPVNKTGRPHTLPSGYVDHPGDYRDGISGEVLFKHGAWRGRVIARDWKSHMIEFGTKKMDKNPVMRRTAAYLRGTGS